MSGMKIIPIVQGFGEERAVPVLVRRWLRFRNFHRHFEVPDRAINAKGSGRLKVGYDPIRHVGIEHYVHAALGGRPDAILVLIDADDECLHRGRGRSLGPELLARAKGVAAHVPVAVVVANREYEAWFLASLQSMRMSRRDDVGARAPASRRSAPAGASPASVNTGVPSSRPQPREETRAGQAGCQEPLRREPARGPQHHVKPAASTHSQSESRAAHVTAKAMSVAPQSGGVRAAGLGGVQGAARVQGAERNTRDPSARPSSRQRGSYKPSAKTSAAQRESEGTVVVTRPVTNNAGGAKGPCGGNVGNASTREGMTGRTGSNHPGGRKSIDKVRQLQRRLWSAAKQQPGRRFHALVDRIYRRDVLWEAWKRVKRNHGAAGVDALTLADVEQAGVEGFLADLGA